MDEQVPQYFSLYSWLFWPKVHPGTDEKLGDKNAGGMKGRKTGLGRILMHLVCFVFIF